MPKTFLHQHEQRNRRLYLVGWNTAACGICSVMDQNIFRMQDSWAWKQGQTASSFAMIHSRGHWQPRCMGGELVCHLWNQERRLITSQLPPVTGNCVLELKNWSELLAKADCALTSTFFLFLNECSSRWRINESFWEELSSIVAVNRQYTGLNRWLKGLCTEIYLGSSSAGER